jgi:uncharacterized protein (TIGR03790 family)
MRRLAILIVVLVLAVFVDRSALALEAITAADVIVVYNKDAAGSKGVARHYVMVRDVPEANLVAVSLPDTAWMDRRHMADLVRPIQKRRDALIEMGKNPLVLLTYGIPLKITGPEPGMSVNQFRKQVEKGTRRTRKAVLDAIGELSHATRSNGTPDLTSLPNRQLIQYGRERTMAAAEALAKVVDNDAETDRIAPLKEAIENATGSRLRREGGAELDFLFRGIPSKSLNDIAKKTRHAKGVLGELKFWLELALVDPTNKSDAAVDSELSLALGGDFQIAARLPNPWLTQYDGRLGIEAVRQTITPVSRLDGPTPALAKQLVNDALVAEKTGLMGHAYIDARGFTDPKNANYPFDQSLRQLAHKLEAHMPVVLNNRQAVFHPGSAPDAALYVGWYSMARYVPAFTWNTGAVGYHAASTEAQGLHRPQGDQWVKRMIEAGVAATIGPVAEPYLDSFPPPDRFFPRLLDGENLITAYYRTLPHLSWRQVLFGDPLYRPFPK